MSHAGIVALAGCATAPMSPTIMALPGTGKSFDQFRADDSTCQAFASQRTGGVSTQSAAAGSALGGGAVGTALGAAAGATFNGSRGAAVGAGVGLLSGSMIGAGMAQSSSTALQAHYDEAYVQCVYAKGERVPVPLIAADVYPTQEAAPRSQRADNTPPPPSYDQPPPPGY